MASKHRRRDQDGEIYDHEVAIESATPQKVAHAIAAFARRVIEVKRATVVAARKKRRVKESAVRSLRK